MVYCCDWSWVHPILGDVGKVSPATQREETRKGREIAHYVFAVVAGVGGGGGGGTISVTTKKNFFS